MLIEYKIKFEKDGMTITQRVIACNLLPRLDSDPRMRRALLNNAQEKETNRR